MNKHNQLHIRTESGFALMVVIGAVAVVGVISLALWQWRQHQATLTPAAGTSSTTTPTPPAVTPSPTPKPADSADTMANPAKVTSADGKTYFVYGAPAG
jgi:cytoskeletal protein RodZ